jgi:transposase
MSVHARDEYSIPAETVRVAHAAFPNGNALTTLRDELGEVYPDSAFAALFPRRGQPAQAPGRLALVTVLQFAEGLADRQAADAVRSRIDWKYLLGLDLTDAGFDFSVLSEFRQRLLDGQAEQQLLDDLLTRFQAKGLLKARGTQRTDATHVLDAVRTLNRLQLVGETLRAALNALAQVVPEWLKAQVPADWYERYGPRLEAQRLPRAQAERKALALTIGRDGYQLFTWLSQNPATVLLRHAPAVEALRQVWLQNYYHQDEQIHWREAANLPPGAQLIQSPYDLETRYSTKRATQWSGYKVHVTETCDAEAPHVITHVETTPATTPDVEMTDTIHRALAAKALLPAVHLLDGAYVDAQLLVQSPRDYEVQLVGPAPADTSRQAHQAAGFDLSHFEIDWDQQRATCPQGQTSVTWSPSHDGRDNAVIHVRFAAAACRACRVRAACTTTPQSPRSLKLRARAEHETLAAARVRQTTPEFKTQYKRRAGIEGTISQGVRAFELRRTRYLGLNKTHLQHVATAVAINWARFVDWVTDAVVPRPVSPFMQLATSTSAT